MRVLAVCGMGFGTSLMLLMNIQEIGEKYGIKVDGEATDLGSAKGRDFDLIVASSEIAKELKDEKAPVIGINNLLDNNEIEEKILPILKELNK
ncbi:PTS sugar transporter subunit IIB [Sporosalibacterium faouarense]|uniref:PTS sugar transporter subunit IIB n=1 Tax=Sporosalibacterium faouarense TaxID=516123 RepID=UPI00192C52A7|nr:PTS sugar transporter subunit IIB [Sporosalibacterium faouarense]